MSTSLADWAGEDLIVHRDDLTGSWSIIAIHSTARGPAVGGTRMRTYSSPEDAIEDAMRLSEGMTLKTAVAGLPCGGAKAVIAIPSTLNDRDRERLLLDYAARIESLGGSFVTGPDMGTGETDMDLLGTVTSHVFCRSHGAGGFGTASPWTAAGVYSGIQASLQHTLGSDDLKGILVLIQGTGEVGARLAELLHDAGARLLLADVDSPRATALAGNLAGATVIGVEDVYDTHCDVYAPCAMGATLNSRTIPRLRCRAVAGAANNQLETPEDSNRLRARGILYAPDYVINAGGIIRAVGAETLGWSAAEIDGRVTAIGESLLEIYRKADRAGISTAAAAAAVANESLFVAA